MKAIVEENGNTLHVAPHGRLNASGAQDLEKAVALADRPWVRHVDFDMAAVDYISSAGMRSFLIFYRFLKERGGTLSLSNLSDYCREIMATTGFESLFAGGRAAEPPDNARYAAEPCPVETIESDIGAFRVREKGRSDGVLCVTGNIDSIVNSDIGEDSVFTRPMGPGDCLAGVGGAGRDIHDFFPVIGQIMAAGGSVMWLPTDGKATPDYFLLDNGAERMQLRLAWGLSFSAGFDEVMSFESDSDAGASVSDLYSAMFELARMRDPAFKGAVAMAMRADMGSVFAEALQKAPTRYFAPADGSAITAPSNRAKWLKTDIVARSMDVPALVCGAGIKLSAGSGGYDRALVTAAFGRPETGNRSMALYNSIAVYPGSTGLDASRDMRPAMKELAFSSAPLDTARLLDSATIKTALLGVKYIAEFVAD